ncbi:hypothetical protein [Methylomonas sp. CM2]|uniref:hypothetical protein n=1 Tax=Methylomonas sp. CM2 TaxID=3417647 RepID=UPI003CEFE3AC
MTNAELAKITGIAENNAHVTSARMAKSGHAERLGSDLHGSLRWALTPQGRSYYAGLGISPTDPTEADEIDGLDDTNTESGIRANANFPSPMSHPQPTEEKPEPVIGAACISIEQIDDSNIIAPRVKVLDPSKPIDAAIINLLSVCLDANTPTIANRADKVQLLEQSAASPLLPVATKNLYLEIAEDLNQLEDV